MLLRHTALATPLSSKPKTHPDKAPLQAAYMFYTVPGATPLPQLMNDALILAHASGGRADGDGRWGMRAGGRARRQRPGACLGWVCS